MDKSLELRPESSCELKLYQHLAELAAFISKVSGSTVHILASDGRVHIEGFTYKLSDHELLMLSQATKHDMQNLYTILKHSPDQTT
jgi:hypothetical protein